MNKKQKEVYRLQLATDLFYIAWRDLPVELLEEVHELVHPKLDEDEEIKK